ncbi:class I SAM-dependent methyltransferase [Algiphilus sp.]|uniref:class I SAM-dependent methyltransferase n=1 Tax=Algiphilus sp. TaxID=1872431 RepID=UPI003B523821
MKKYRNMRALCAAGFLVGLAAYVWIPMSWGLLVSAVAAVVYAGVRERETRKLFKDINRGLVTLRGQFEAAMDVRRLIDRQAMPLPPSGGWAASADFVALIGETLKSHRPRHVMELGSGLSTVFLAEMLSADSGTHLTSLDHDPMYAEQTRARLRVRGLDSQVRVVDAPLQPVELSQGSYRWYALPKNFECPPIDLLIVDGPPSATCPMSRYPALPLLAPFLSQDCIILVDDADRPDEKKMVAQWLKEFGGVQRRIPLEKGAIIIYLGQSDAALQAARHD